MTKEELMKAFEMRIDGYTYEEIADKLCYTAGNIQYALKSAYRGDKATLRRAQRQGCAYPNLITEIFNSHASLKDFSRTCGVNYLTLCNTLNKVSQPKPHTIQKLVERTGKPAEYLFATKEN